MKRLLLALLLLLLYGDAFSQKYTRKEYDYIKMKLDTLSVCDEKIINELETAFTAIDNNNSTLAVQISKDIYNKTKNCPLIFEVYGYSLFRNGDWNGGIEMIENGIEKFGKVPGLIKRRSEMSIEMFDFGTGQKLIDGNTVYKKNTTAYSEEEFQQANINSALKDLLYLQEVYGREEEAYILGKLYRYMKNYNESNKYFEIASYDPNFELEAEFAKAENYVSQQNYHEAEFSISELLKELPYTSILYSKMAEIKLLTKDTIASQELNKQAIYYNHVFEFMKRPYSKDNYEQLLFFGSEKNSAKDKLEKLEKIYKQKNNENTIPLCILILKLHANHGNGVEERATEILAEIGKSSLPMVHELFLMDVATCTITNLANIMATVKDSTSWVHLQNYLPTMARMPSTLIPPSVPEMIIKFNEEKGVREILKVVQPILNQETEKNAAGLGPYVYYLPLKKIDRNKLKKIAKELGYSDDLFKKLEENIK